jgi:four helix bundle protein
MQLWGKERVETVPRAIRDDSVWRVEAYRLALFAGDLAWHDATKLLGDKRTISMADQLHRAAGAISGDIAEGYSRRSGKDQARFYEYALGSAREARDWYYKGRHVLGETVANHRMELHTQIIKSLLTIIPNERGYRMREEGSPYSAGSLHLLDNPPMPDSEHTSHAQRTTHHVAAPRTTHHVPVASHHAAPPS